MRKKGGTWWLLLLLVVEGHELEGRVGGLRGPKEDVGLFTS